MAGRAVVTEERTQRRKPKKKKLDFKGKGREGFDPYGVLDALPEPYRGWEDAERSLINLLVEAKNRESPGGKIDKVGYLAEYMKIKFSNIN